MRERVARMLAVHRRKITLRSCDGFAARREPIPRQERRDEAVSRCDSSVQRLGHRPDVFFQAARKRRGDAESVRDLLSVQPITRAAAAAAPTVPMDDVQCHPRL